MSQAHPAIVDEIERCFAQADLRRFRNLVFTECSRTPVSTQAAASLQEGLGMTETGLRMAFRRSFVACCLANECTAFVQDVMNTAKDLLREAGARHNVPAAGQVAFLKGFFALLNCGEREPALDFLSPADLLSERLTSHRELVQALIEYLPDDDGLQRARERSGEFAAFVAECEMDLRIRQQLAAAVTVESHAHPARARQRML